MICVIQNIPYWKLALTFIPVALVILIMWQWKMKIWSSAYAVSRMLIQLMLIGYALAFIFNSDSSLVVMVVLFVMLIAASLIALRTVSIPLKIILPNTFLSILIGGGSVLFLITQFVLDLPTWYEASFVIPLAGMIFANSMNAISLAAERLESELASGKEFVEARNTALSASLIPITNALFAVGLVSLPGMMTGQILSGVSPFIAARYQIMVMSMIFGSCGLSAALFLFLTRIKFTNRRNSH